jgi:Tol biopolymer transport system component
MATRLYILFFLLITGFLSAQNSLIRSPRISPNAQEMAFSYQGDIWVYNFNTQQTKRITIHEAYESNPVWNTSGDKIAFSSNRKGANNIFTISKNGGTPIQLTYYPTADTPYDWTSSNDIVFATTRVLKGPEWDEQIYRVNFNGGTPQRFITALGSMATVSPDGNLVAFVKGACRISREDYSGSAQRDVWIYNIKTGNYFQVTSSEKNDHSPLWDAAGNLFYIGAESGRYNIFKQSINTDGSLKGDSKKMTNQNKNGVVSFSVSNQGTILYTTLFDLYQISGGQSKKINLKIESDYKFETEKEVSTSSDISDFDVSPNGKLVAI